MKRKKYVMFWELLFIFLKKNICKTQNSKSQ